MSRSGYNDYSDSHWAIIRWRGAVTSAIRGRRGQQFFRDLVAALDALPQRRLIRHELERKGEHCTLGALAAARGLPVAEMDPEDPPTLARDLGVAEALVREVLYENDEGGWYDESPERRWQRIRNWAQSRLTKTECVGVEDTTP